MCPDQPLPRPLPQGGGSSVRRLFGTQREASPGTLALLASSEPASASQEEPDHEPTVRTAAPDGLCRSRCGSRDAALGDRLRRRTVVHRRPAAADQIQLRRPALRRHPSVDRAGQFGRRADRADPAALRHAQPGAGVPGAGIPTAGCSTGRAGRKTTTNCTTARWPTATRSPRKATLRAAGSCISARRAIPAPSSRCRTPRRCASASSTRCARRRSAGTAAIRSGATGRGEQWELPRVTGRRLPGWRR